MQPFPPILAGMLALLAGPAAHAFGATPVDAVSIHAALAEPGESPSPSDTVTPQSGHIESSVTFGTVWQSSRRPGYQTAPLSEPDPDDDPGGGE